MIVTDTAVAYWSDAMLIYFKLVKSSRVPTSNTRYAFANEKMTQNDSDLDIIYN